MRTFPQRLKPHWWEGAYGTAEAVPLQSHVKLGHCWIPPIKLGSSARKYNYRRLYFRNLDEIAKRDTLVGWAQCVQPPTAAFLARDGERRSLTNWGRPARWN